MNPEGILGIRQQWELIALCVNLDLLTQCHNEECDTENYCECGDGNSANCLDFIPANVPFLLLPFFLGKLYERFPNYQNDKNDKLNQLHK